MKNKQELLLWLFFGKTLHFDSNDLIVYSNLSSLSSKNGNFCCPSVTLKAYSSYLVFASEKPLTLLVESQL